MTDYIQANTDGVLHDAREASISPLNRGFLYGDAVYEVWRTYGGHLFAFREHWERLQRSAGALGMTLPFGAPDLEVEIRRTMDAFCATAGEPDACYVRLQVSRGEGAIGLDPALAEEPSWTILVRSLRELTAAELERGLHLEVAESLRRNHPDTLNPAWKTGNYLNNLLALQEVKSRGADEVVLLNLNGAITEASTRNLFFVAGRTLYTPALSDGILEGVTRRLLILLLAEDKDYTVEEASITVDRIREFEECFVTSTTQDIVPVRRIGSTRFRTGPGTAGLVLRERFRARAGAHRSSWD